ncbi:uncharacterized protein LOC108891257 isoform X3 [Lates calcarifer]|uniref:Uncharacterized protein LOC108891257 isoform X3 n=1 Tax=Lates calcarifer TaxID=8187 RepID=A0AAJ8DND4_LATCA|nr:uncharacterized protein LOC108891257 isoform X3 [Lates calcarifer]
MRVNIYSCLFVFVLGCNVTAGPMRGIPPPPTTMTSHPPTTTPSTPLKNTGMKYKILKEKGSITLCCPQPVEGKVTWSRVNEGKVDILTVDGEGEKEHTDKCSSSSTHESLHIKRAAVSDSGCYLCNNETVVQLFVIPSGIQRKVRKQRESITLHCPQPVEGKVTWSRVTEQQGKVDILTVDGDGQKVLIDDQDRRYGSSDKSLHINRLSVSDSGNYFCNNEPAVLLSVIPSGTPRLSVMRRTNISLQCSPGVGGSGVPTWSREIAGKQQQMSRRVSTEDKTLTVTRVQPDDSGLYYCDGKPAAYLTVTEGEKPERAPDGPRTDLGMVVGISAPVLLLVLLFIIYFTRRRRLKRRENEERGPVYEEILEGSVCQPLNGITSTYCMVTFPAGSHQNDPTYATISDLPLTATMTGSQLANTYSLLEKPKAAGNNNNDQYL